MNKIQLTPEETIELKIKSLEYVLKMIDDNTLEIETIEDLIATVDKFFNYLIKY